MASTELQTTETRSAETSAVDNGEEQMIKYKREDDVNSVSSVITPFVEDAQIDLGKDTSEIMPHTMYSCAPILPMNNEPESSFLDSEEESKRVCQENVCYVNMPEVNTIIEETTQNLYASKIQAGNQNQNLKDVTITEKEFLMKELKHLHCPFTWNLNYKNTKKTTTEMIIKICNEKLKLLDEEERDDAVDEEFQWYRFIMTLTLCHEHYICRNFSEALAKQKECENLINLCQSSKNTDTFFENIKEALIHVVNACKCYLFVSLNRLADAVKLMNGISRYKDMKKSSMAAINGIQAAMLMEYGYDGTKAALEYAEKAVNLDENEAEWHFLHGKILGRLRRVDSFNGIPSPQELTVLEQAVEITRKASHMVFLAQAYREAALGIFVKNKSNLNPVYDIMTKMNKRALQLYRVALALNGKSACINMRCALGLSKLPGKFQKLEKAEECIERALNIASGNPMVNHIAGTIYEKLKRCDLAERFYEKASELGAYGAHLDIMRMKMKQDKQYDALPHLEKLLQMYTEDRHMQRTFIVIGSYHFYVKNDVLTALDYWMKAIKRNPHAEMLKEHRCVFADLETHVNLYQVIVDEIRLYLQQKIHNENAFKLCKMLHYCIKMHPDLFNSEPHSWRLEKNIQGRTKKQIKNQERRPQHKHKIAEELQNNIKKENQRDSLKVDFNANKKQVYKNEDHLQLKQQENWRQKLKVDFNVNKKQVYKNEGHLQLKQQENWRQKPIQERTKKQIRNWERSLQHKHKITEQLQNNIQKESQKDNSEVNFNVSKKQVYKNEGYMQLHHQENWRCSPRNVSSSDENCGVKKEQTDGMGIVDSASHS